MRRRDFLRSSVMLVAANGAPVANTLAASNSFLPDQDLCTYVAAAKSRLGEASFVCLDATGKLHSQYEIPARGHSFARSVQGHTAAIARRPADFCLIIDDHGNKVGQFNAAPSRHFYGHGVYDDKGEYLYLTENDYGYHGSRGVIGVYSVNDNYARVTEFDSGGIGPHQIELTADGLELVVANGGIQTHPETGRKKLNLETMRPSLAFIGRQSGKLRQALVLDEAYSTSSIRHMSQHSSGAIYLALQQQVKTEPACLLAYFDPSENTLEKMPLPQQHETQLSGYVGDISLDVTEQYLALSSPYGNTLLILDLVNGQNHAMQIADVCGLSKTANGAQFIATTGGGRMLAIDVVGESINQKVMTNSSSLLSWDNHLLSLF